MTIISLDVGGSSVKHGLVSLTAPDQITVQTTPIDSNGTAEQIIKTFAAIITGYQHTNPNLKSVAMGFPGPSDYQQGISYIKGLEKYEAIYGLNVRDAIREASGQSDLNIRMRNDAEAAIVGELIFGAGRGFRRVIGLTLGTGMGSALFADGVRIYEGYGIPEPSGELFSLPVEGERADDVFSTRGVLKRLARHGVMVEQVKDADLSDPKVQAAYHEMGTSLGAMLTPIITAFEADCLLILGGISAAFEAFADPLTAACAPATVKKGELGGQAALLGAAHLFHL